MSDGTQAGHNPKTVRNCGRAILIIGLAAALVRVERRTATPLIPFRLLSDRLFRSTMVVSMFATSALTPSVRSRASTSASLPGSAVNSATSSTVVEVWVMLIRRTAARFPRGVDYDLKFTDRRGSVTRYGRDAELNVTTITLPNRPAFPGKYIAYWKRDHAGDHAARGQSDGNEGERRHRRHVPA